MPLKNLSTRQVNFDGNPVTDSVRTNSGYGVSTRDPFARLRSVLESAAQASKAKSQVVAQKPDDLLAEAA